jgi:hypothetical protein
LILTAKSVILNITSPADSFVSERANCSPLRK